MPSLISRLQIEEFIRIRIRSTGSIVQTFTLHKDMKLRAASRERTHLKLRTNSYFSDYGIDLEFYCNVSL